MQVSRFLVDCILSFCVILWVGIDVSEEHTGSTSKQQNYVKIYETFLLRISCKERLKNYSDRTGIIT
jgi:hypothetical protein